MAGVEKYRDVGALRLLAEFKQALGHFIAGKIGAFDDFKAHIAKHGRHRLGVDRRVRKLRYVFVGAIADDKGDAPVGLGRLRREQHAKQGNNNGEIAHLKAPDRIEHLTLQRVMADYTRNPSSAPQKLGCFPSPGGDLDDAVMRPS